MTDFPMLACVATRRDLGIESDDALLAADRSGVVELPEAMHVSVAATRRAIWCWWASAGALFIASGSLLATLGEPPSPLRLCAAAGCLIASQACLAVGGFRELVLARRIARARVPPVGFTVDRVIGIEPADTFRKPKSMCDDVGALAHDPDRRRVLIDGSRHRYLICGRDVERIDVAAAGVVAGATVRFRSGGGIISVTLSERMLFTRIGRAGVRPPPTARLPLVSALAATLGVTPGTVQPSEPEQPF